MKKLFTLLTLALISIGSAWGAVTDLEFTATKTVTAGGEIWWTTSTNVASANTTGWCSKDENSSANKYGNITPSLSGDVVDTDPAHHILSGVIVKGGNTPSNLTTSKKALVFKVTNATAITAYGATTGSSGAAGLQWSIYKAGAGNTWTAVASSAKGKAASTNNTATISITGLTASDTYIVSIEGGYSGTAGQDVGTSNQDVVVYAIKFAAPNAGAPTINTQPVSANYEAGGVATALSVEATASSGELSYQWYKNTTEASTTGATSIPSATSATYTPDVASAGTTYYYCVVTDAAGSTNSNFATITVTNVLSPSITFAGTTVTISYGGSGTVYYTTDGTVPSNSNGTEYENPFNLTDACTVRAIAIKGGNSSSLVKYDCYVEHNSAISVLGYKRGTASGTVWTSTDNAYTLSAATNDIQYTSIFVSQDGFKMNANEEYTLQVDPDVQVTSIKVVGRTWLNGAASTMAITGFTPNPASFVAGEEGHVSYIKTIEFTPTSTLGYGASITITPGGNQFGGYFEIYGVKRTGPAEPEMNVTATWDFSTLAAQTASGAIGTSGSYTLKATNGKSKITYVGGSSDTYDSSNGYLKHGGASSSTRYFILKITSDGVLGLTTKTNNGAFTIKKAANTTTDWSHATAFSPAVTITTTADATEVTGNITYDADKPYLIIGFGSKLYTQKITWTPSVETVALETTAEMEGWRSFYDATNSYTVDENTTVYVATSEAAGTVTMTPNAAGIPAHTPVILKTTAGNHKMTLTKASVDAYEGTNLLRVTTGGEVLDNYRLGYGAAGVGFYKYNVASAPADIVYLNVAASSRESLTINFEDEATGVNEVRGKKEEGRDEFYNLAGQRVAQPTKGLYIVNGKKVIVK